MADPLSVIGAVATIIQIGSSTLKLIKKVHSADKDRQNLIAEIHSISTVCQTIIDCVEIDTDGWLSTLKTLQNQDGPVYELKQSLDDLHARPSKTTGGSHRLSSMLGKEAIQDLMSRMGRQKNVLSLASMNDNLRS